MAFANLDAKGINNLLRVGMNHFQRRVRTLAGLDSTGRAMKLNKF